MYIYVKLTKEWGGFNAGDVVRFGYNKGVSRINEGFGVEVPKQSAVNAPIEKKPVVETATVDQLAGAETAEITPVKRNKRRSKK